MPANPLIFEKLAIALVLGLLVGLQRERTAPGMPGIRTFPLITLLGVVSALLAQSFGGWIVAAGLLGVTAVVIYANLRRAGNRDPDPGTTTDVAALVMFGVGALLMIAPREIPIALGGGVAVLLQLKPEMHRFVTRLGDNDVKAIMQFVLITCIILPVLPNARYGPMGVFNPFETWMFVVLIVGMSLAGYVAYKFFGQNAGTLLGGLLGGLISSTATTVSYARQARSGAAGANSAAMVIMIASTVAFLRVLLAAGIVSQDLMRHSAVPLMILVGLTFAPTLVLWWLNHRRSGAMPEPSNPTHLKSAIVFAIMYAVVVMALAIARQHLGSRAVLGVAALSGLTDMDAITLSTARLALVDPTMAATGWRLIVAAGVSNLVAKAVLAASIGGWRMGLRIGLLFLPAIVGGGLLILLYR